MPLLLDEYRNWNGYLVSRQGRIIGKNGKEMHPSIGTDGYPEVCVRINNKSKVKYLHRIVGPLFLVNPKPSEYTELDHISGQKTDCRVSNLRWVSRSINIKARHDLRRQQGLSACTERELAHRESFNKAVAYRGVIYPSQTKMSVVFNVTQAAISYAVKRGYFRGHPIRFAA